MTIVQFIHYEKVENGAGFVTIECGSSGLPGGWNDIRGVFGFSVAADGLAGCRSESCDRSPLGRRRCSATFFLHPTADGGRRGGDISVARERKQVANDQAANRWNLSSAATFGRVSRGCASASSSR